MVRMDELLVTLGLFVTALGCAPRLPLGQSSDAARAAKATPTPPGRCRELPDDRRSPWPGAAARAADCPSPRNSDGTLKRLPDAPSSEPGHTLLFRHADFGPPSLQKGLLGPDWWSWEGGGSFEPCDEFDVRVVVHDGRSLAEVEARFPTIKGKSDYRLITRDDALRHLDASIAELAAEPTGPEEYDFGPLRRELEQTRRLIHSCLPR
jgi:hypothetical protein